MGSDHTNMENQMKIQNSQPDGQVQQIIGTGASARIDTEFVQNTKKDDEETVVNSEEQGGGDEESEYDENTHGIPSEIVGKTIMRGKVHYNCHWNPSKSGTVYDEPSWASRQTLIENGFRSLIEKYENEIKQKRIKKSKKTAKKDAKVCTMCGSFLQILKLSSHLCAF